jgi:hypothetical protein
MANDPRAGYWRDNATPGGRGMSRAAALLEDVPLADPHDQVESLEERIERLADAIERCRKFILAGRIAIGTGGLWLLAALVGLLPGAGSLIGATAALIGGIVTFGTNIATLNELRNHLAAAERLRAQTIERMELRSVASAAPPANLR